MSSGDLFHSLRRPPTGRWRVSSQALRRASHQAAGTLIESLDARQLPSSSTPAPIVAALHAGGPALVAPALPASVVTDRQDYSPGQTVTITGTGFRAGEKVRLQVLHIDGTPNTAPEHLPWTVRARKDGSFTTAYTVGADDLNT